jgi:hypothetical protein
MAYTTINKSSSFFNTLTWSGDSSSPENITGVGFQPDFIWGKLRNTAYSHQLYDSVRGFGNDKEIQSDNTTAQGGGTADQYGYLSGVVADGFTATAGSDSGADKYGYWNESGKTYASWNWKAGTTSGIATNGSTTITPSSYSFNQTSGFSILAYTGNVTSGAKLAHGLGVTPDMVIIKNYNSGSEGWSVYHTGLGNTHYIKLNTTAAKVDNVNRWNDTDPDSINITLGDDPSVNGSTTMVAYCFADVKGYSKFGSYEGNGNVDGSFVYTGFRPAWTMVKSIDSADSWQIKNVKSNPYNVADKYLMANQNVAEVTEASASGWMDILSNGFKPRASNAQVNGNHTYIYAAFGQTLVGTNNVPCTAR